MDSLASIVCVDLGPNEIMKISAIAGSGKSFTLRAYARPYPAKRMLVTTFNKHIALDQRERCASLPHVDVCTLDALAFRATADVHRGIVVGEIDMSAARLPDHTWSPYARGVLRAFCASADRRIDDNHLRVTSAELPETAGGIVWIARP
jgi:hypothetical protein